jgi:hypothetical protein
MRYTFRNAFFFISHQSNSNARNFAGAAAGAGGHPLSPPVATGTTLRGGLVHQRRSSCVLAQWATWRASGGGRPICESANLRTAGVWVHGGVGVWGCEFQNCYEIS